MILGTGIDIIEIERVVCKQIDEHWMKRVFTDAERIMLHQKGGASLAGRFCVKEAVSKALGISLSLGGMREIEVLQDDQGSPVVYLYGKMRERFKQINGEKIWISISHSKNNAIGMAIVEG